MGGYTFGVVARRLTTEQHSALLRYASARLAPFTLYSIASPLTAADKTTHGDLDILMGNWAQGVGFKYNFAVDGAGEQGQECEGDLTRWRQLGCDAGHEWSCDEIRQWAGAVARALGATSWQNHQHGVSLAVPCGVIADEVPHHGPDEFFQYFFQIDLRMIRPDRFGFAIFIMSYSITALLLGQAIRCLSPALVIHHEHLVIRHSPYPSLPAIEVELTCDVKTMLNWLGLDYERWKEGFEAQHEFWTWIAGPSPTSAILEAGSRMPAPSLIRKAWTIFSRTNGDFPRVKIRHQPACIAEHERFRDWLRTAIPSTLAEKQLENAEATKLEPAQPLSPPAPALRHYTYTLVTRTTVNVDRLTGESTTSAVKSVIEPIKSQSTDTSTATHYRHPDKPVELDNSATEALSHFGMEKVYRQAVDGLKEQAAAVFERHNRKRLNREYAQNHEDPTVRARKAKEGAKMA